MAGSEAAASVLDASALLAHLNEEEGASAVRQAMADGAVISVVNWMEVLSKIAERGEDPELAAAEMKGAGLIGGVVSVEAVTEQDSIEAARLRPLTKERGLSLADRSCLALAARLGLSVVTGDRAWQNLPRIDVAVKLIR
ncbi:MAG TPA: type II toxin-antitoxin system VapC family toxin [Solirubrobacterales bacterium]|nr:type II toxin-antitoxin system VapC family toxin [Solirubrobacterales bacterium]